MKTKVVQHVPRINISIWHMTCDMWHNYKYSLLSIDMKTKVVQHVSRINISISHITCDMWKAKCDMWHNYKYSLLSLHMKTKVVQHVIWEELVPSCCQMTIMAYRSPIGQCQTDTRLPWTVVLIMEQAPTRKM